MSGPVSYHRDESIAVIIMDDGKVNALGPGMLAEIGPGVRPGRGRRRRGGCHRGQPPGAFSGGFDLKVFRSGDAQASIDMLKAGFELSHRLLSFPKPVVSAITGHAIAMGSFLACSTDHRIAARATTFRPTRSRSAWCCRGRHWRF